MTIAKIILAGYYVCFVLDNFPEVMRHGWQRRWVWDTAREVATTDATVDEGRRMMQIPVRETGFDASAVGHRGERGRWQVLGGDRWDAQAALERMRGPRGMMSYVGCGNATPKTRVTLPNGVRTTCQELVDNRVGAADAYGIEHPPPRSLLVPTGEASEVAERGPYDMP